MATKAGGYSDTKNATEEIQKYCDQVSFNPLSFFITLLAAFQLDLLLFHSYTGEVPIGGKDKQEICTIQSS